MYSKAPPSSRGRTAYQPFSTSYTRPGSKGTIYGGNNLSYTPTAPMMGPTGMPASSYSGKGTSSVGASNSSNLNSTMPCTTCCGGPPPWQQSSSTANNSNDTKSSMQQRTGIGAYPGHKPGTPIYTTTTREQSQGVLGQVASGSKSGNFQNLSSVALTTSGRPQPPMNITCANNNYQVLSSQNTNYSGGSSSYGHRNSGYSQQQSSNYGYNNGLPQPDMSIGNYQALNNVRQQQQQMASGNYQFSQSQGPQQQAVAFQTQALTKQPLAPGNYYASSPSSMQQSQSQNSGQNTMGSHYTEKLMDTSSMMASQSPSQLSSLNNNSNRMSQPTSYHPYNQQYSPSKSQEQPQQINFNPHQYNTQSSTVSSSSNYSSQSSQPTPQVQTIRVGAPAPGQVLEPQTIRVTAPAPSPQSMEPQVNIVLPKGMKLADPETLAQMQAQMNSGQYQQEGGDTGYGDASSSSNNNAAGSSDDGSGGVKYIPLSWGELLGGGKDGLNGLKVIMSPPPADPNQNRQLRVAFGNQAVTTQPGEVPLKVLSINPVEGYQMGAVPGLEGNATSEMEKQSAMMQQQSQQQQQQQHSQQYPNRTQSLTAPSPPQLPTGASPRTRASPSSGRMPSYSSATNYGSGPNSNNTVAKRFDFAGTKFY